MAGKKKTYTYEFDERGKARIVEDKGPTRAQRISMGGYHGDFQKDGFFGRVFDSLTSRKKRK